MAAGKQHQCVGATFLSDMAALCSVFLRLNNNYTHKMSALA